MSVEKGSCLTKKRLVWFLIPAALGAFLGIGSHSAVAQQRSGPDLGQQGEFEGEHVDTGAAAFDIGTEAAEAPAMGEAIESVKTSPSTVSTTLVPAGTRAATDQGLGSTQDLNVEGDFDLEEIAGADVVEAN
jgi:hypothetical protein